MFNSPGDSSDNKGSRRRSRRGPLFGSDEADSDEEMPVEQSSDEDMDCKDKLFSSPGASGAYAGGRSRRSPKQTAASAVGFRAACENPSAPAVGNKPPLPLPKFTPSPCKGTPMGPRSSIRTPMGPYSSGIAGAAFDCTPVNQRPTNAEITGGLTKDKVIFFDFDGVLSPVGLVSDRRVFNLERIDKVLFGNGITTRQAELNILKQQYSLCICSQNIHGNIVTFCNQFYPGFFDVIIGKKAIGCPPIIKQVEMLKVLSGGTALFIDDSQGEIDAITDERIDPKKIDAWTLDSEPAVLPVEAVKPVQLRLRF